ncbi:MAG TPA: EAL domain-containing protein [Sphingomicrobium sp.]|nr:EAL domain-containing protein [Sphingomicrobium sp.]
MSATRLAPAGRNCRQPAQLSNQLSRLSQLMLLAVTLVTFAGLYWSTLRSDEISVERQSRVAHHSIELALDELALQQETVAIWDESAEKMVTDPLDHQWLFDNLGSWLNRIFAHDATFLLDGQDRPVQAVVDGRRVAIDRYGELAGDLAPLVDTLRGRNQAANGRHDRHPGQRLHANASVRTTPRSAHRTRLTLVGGRPAAASAMLIKPSTEDYVRPKGNWPILISVRFLDGSFMKELQARHLIDDARYSRAEDNDSEEQALPLLTEDGRHLGYLIWRPELPGSRLLQQLLPATALGIAVLAIMMLLLTRSLKHTLRERAAFEARAAHLAFHDSLTGLPNRALLNDRLQASLSDASREPLALLLIDLDRFKQVNDTLGHLAGDQLIREFAARLLRLARPRDTVARLGGDEFAVILVDGWRRGDVERLCQSIIEVFSVPFKLLGTQVFGGASIGAVYCDKGRGDATEMLRRADVALYQAKASGRGQARIFEPWMDENGKLRARLEGDLREALKVDQLALWSQPQVGRDGKALGQELLLRWRHPSLGFISPQDIIPLAEETGLILPIGEWVLRQAAKAAIDASSQFTAVNLSPLQLAQPDFADRLTAIFAGLDPQRIELEVTEQILLDESTNAAHNLHQLRRNGFRIALDDFGTGYSSLSYLRQLSVDKIKIDRSFVADLPNSAEARAIVAAIVTLGRALGLTVSAEGVETKGQADILLTAGCDQLQGFLFGAPQPLPGPIGERAAS